MFISPDRSHSFTQQEPVPLTLISLFNVKQSRPIKLNVFWVPCVKSCILIQLSYRMMGQSICSLSLVLYGMTWIVSAFAVIRNFIVNIARIDVINHMWWGNKSVVGVNYSDPRWLVHSSIKHTSLFFNVRNLVRSCSLWRGPSWDSLLRTTGILYNRCWLVFLLLRSIYRPYKENSMKIGGNVCIVEINEAKLCQ